MIGAKAAAMRENTGAGVAVFENVWNYLISDGPVVVICASSAVGRWLIREPAPVIHAVYAIDMDFACENERRDSIDHAEIFVVKKATLLGGKNHYRLTGSSVNEHFHGLSEGFARNRRIRDSFWPQVISLMISMSSSRSADREDSPNDP
jgi:hypothetical protein